MMLHSSALLRSVGGKAQAPAKITPHFRALSAEDAQTLALYREVANQSPRELLLVLEKMLEDSFSEVYDDYKKLNPSQFTSPEHGEPEKIDFRKLSTQIVHRKNYVEQGQKFKFYESVLIEKAEDIQALLESLPIYGRWTYTNAPSQLIKALGQKYILEAHKSTFSVP